MGKEKGKAKETSSSEQVQAENDLGIPNEIWLEILSYMGPKDLAKTRAVCTSWRDLSDSDPLWHPIFLSKFPKGDQMHNCGWRELYYNYLFVRWNASGTTNVEVLENQRKAVRVGNDDMKRGSWGNIQELHGRKGTGIWKYHLLVEGKVSIGFAKQGFHSHGPSVQLGEKQSCCYAFSGYLLYGMGGSHKLSSYGTNDVITAILQREEGGSTTVRFEKNGVLQQGTIRVDSSVISSNDKAFLTVTLFSCRSSVRLVTPDQIKKMQEDGNLNTNNARCLVC